MLVSIDGVSVPVEEARLSIFDRGFLFGDAIYEVIRTHRRRPFMLEAHLARLASSGQAVELDVAPWRTEIEREVLRLGRDLPGEGEAVVRIVVTRGQSPEVDLDGVAGDPLRLVIAKHQPPWAARLYARGIRLRSVQPDEVVGRVAPWVKSNNRQANVMAHRVARARGADDGLFIDPAGYVTEGPTWNVFCASGGEVATPPLTGGILPGITRGVVLGLCAELEIPCRERPIPLDAMRTADEMWITSTTRGVMPVSELDGAPLRAAPGPLTLRLQEAFRRLTEA